MQLQAALQTPESEIVESRFGKISINPAKAVAFPNGVLGLPEQTKFALANFPEGSKLGKRFQVLQSLVETGVAFAVMPLENLGDNIDQNDIDEVKNVLEISDNSMAILLIASVQRTPTGTRLSVNLRAPLFIDTNRMTGYQIVLTNNKYAVQHYI